MIYLLNKEGQVLRQGQIGDSTVKPSYARLCDIEYAQVDGDELYEASFMLDRISPNKRVFTFCGDDARTIAANWS